MKEYNVFESLDDETVVVLKEIISHLKENDYDFNREGGYEMVSLGKRAPSDNIVDLMSIKIFLDIYIQEKNMSSKERIANQINEWYLWAMEIGSWGIELEVDGSYRLINEKNEPVNKKSLVNDRRPISSSAVHNIDDPSRQK